MANERLRDAFLRNGLTPTGVADDLGVDPKTVERWITKGRSPYPRYRHSIANLVQENETYLWPAAISAERADRASQSEVVRIYANRNAVPADLWDRLLERASQRVDILVYVGMFMTEKPNLLQTLATR